VEFTKAITERIVARQGRLHAYERIDPGTTAFIIIDLQNYFTQPGFKCECPASRETFGAVNKLAKALRDAGGLVVWIRTCSDGADKFWSTLHDYLFTPERSAGRLQELSASHRGFEIAEGLDMDPADLVVTKKVYSAFLQGSSDLHEQLQARGISTVLIGGTATNICCESTARDAMMLNYATIMVDDTLSAMSVEEHDNTLKTWALYFGGVLTSDEVIERLSASE